MNINKVVVKREADKRKERAFNLRVTSELNRLTNENERLLEENEQLRTLLTQILDRLQGIAPIALAALDLTRPVVKSDQSAGVE